MTDENGAVASTLCGVRLRGRTCSLIQKSIEEQLRRHFHSDPIPPMTSRGRDDSSLGLVTALVAGGGEYRKCGTGIPVPHGRQHSLKFRCDHVPGKAYPDQFQSL